MGYSGPVEFRAVNHGVFIRDVAEADLAGIRGLNEASVPHVNSISHDDFRWFADNAAYFRVVEAEGNLAGFLIGLTPGIPYDSANYRWFERAYSNFVYVDRIVVDGSARRGGVGSALYDDIIAFGKRIAPMLTCEVNLRPRNDISLAFHEKFGFQEVGTQDTDGGSKTVSLMTRDL